MPTCWPSPATCSTMRWAAPKLYIQDVIHTRRVTSLFCLGERVPWANVFHCVLAPADCSLPKPVPFKRAFMVQLQCQVPSRVRKRSRGGQVRADYILAQE
jgi:hypothetical protein